MWKSVFSGTGTYVPRKKYENEKIIEYVKKIVVCRIWGGGGHDHMYLAEIFSRIFASVHWSVSIWDVIFVMTFNYCEKLEKIEVIMILGTVVRYQHYFNRIIKMKVV